MYNGLDSALQSVAGRVGNVVLTKDDVGLGNVDNTADSAKNVLSATKLTTARTINGVSFDGTGNINIEDRLGTSIASAATTTIGTAGLGDYIHITGTTGITSFGTASSAGIRRTLIFDSGLTITHNATSLICPGAVNIVAVAGTVIEVVAETTSNWRVVSITHPSLSMAELGYLDGVTSNIQTQFSGKQATLVSGTNIKTINGSSVLGSGDMTISALPDQTGNAGKFLTTDGTDASWSNAGGAMQELVTGCTQFKLDGIYPTRVKKIGGKFLICGKQTSTDYPCWVLFDISAGTFGSINVVYTDASNYTWGDIADMGSGIALVVLVRETSTYGMHAFAINTATGVAGSISVATSTYYLSYQASHTDNRYRNDKSESGAVVGSSYFATINVDTVDLLKLYRVNVSGTTVTSSFISTDYYKTGGNFLVYDSDTIIVHGGTTSGATDSYAMVYKISTNTIGTSTQILTGLAAGFYYSTTMLKLANGNVVALCPTRLNAEESKCRAFSVSGTTITAGTEITFYSNGATFATAWSYRQVTEVDGKIYWLRNQHVLVLTYSGTTLTASKYFLVASTTVNLPHKYTSGVLRYLQQTQVTGLYDFIEYDVATNRAKQLMNNIPVSGIFTKILDSGIVYANRMAETGYIYMGGKLSRIFNSSDFGVEEYEDYIISTQYSYYPSSSSTSNYTLYINRYEVA